MSGTATLCAPSTGVEIFIFVTPPARVFVPTGFFVVPTGVTVTGKISVFNSLFFLGFGSGAMHHT